MNPLATKRVRQLTITKPNDKDWKPFIESHEKLNDPLSPDASLKDDLTTKVPLNKEMLKLAEAYRQQLPALMQKRMVEVRTFFLEEIAPLLLSTSNGLGDAKEILEAALEEEPAVSNYFSRIEKAVDTAVEVRILNFVIGLSNLTPAMRSQFLLLTLTKGGASHESSQAIVSALQQLQSGLNQEESRQKPAVKRRGSVRPK